MPKTAAKTDRVMQCLDRQRGILRLAPTYVRRLYVDGGRLLGTRPGGTFLPRVGMWIPERWIASTTRAANPHPIPGEGLSRLADSKLTLAECLHAAGPRMLGVDVFNAHGPEFRVLIKILDGKTPISFHYHASDETVRAHPRRFPGHRFGKDEAYYFLDRPKGQCPYTHVGLYPGTSPTDLRKALARGSDAALELSPYFLQRFDQGFFLPGGVVHRPGTALTLEIQQPSDVYALLDDRMADRILTPAEMHPGFATLEQAIGHIDFKTSTQKDLIERFTLVPRPVSRKRLRGAGEDWIFPLDVCRKFSGKRIRVWGRHTLCEPQAFAVLVWKGRGRFGSHKVAAGDEFFVTAEAAVAGVSVESTLGDALELFACFAAPV